MRRIVHLDVTYAAGAEAVVDALTSTPNVKRTVVSLIPQQTASVDLVAYVDTDQIVAVPSNLLGVYTDPRILINRELSVGETFKVGYRDGADSGQTKFVVVEYEEV
jgi:hypothetical protein